MDNTPRNTFPTDLDPDQDPPGTSGNNDNTLGNPDMPDPDQNLESPGASANEDTNLQQIATENAPQPPDTNPDPTQIPNQVTNTGQNMHQPYSSFEELMELEEFEGVFEPKQALDSAVGGIGLQNAVEREEPHGTGREELHCAVGRELQGSVGREELQKAVGRELQKAVGRELQGAGREMLQGAVGREVLQGAVGRGELQGAFGRVELQGAIGREELQGAFGRELQGDVGREEFQDAVGREEVQSAIVREEVQSAIGRGLQGAVEREELQDAVGRGELQSAFGDEQAQDEAVGRDEPEGATVGEDDNDDGENPDEAGDGEPAKSGGTRKRRGRTQFPPHVLVPLENRFFYQSYLSTQERIELAKKLEIKEYQVTTWFQNRRSRLRRNKEKDPAYTPQKLQEVKKPGPYPHLRNSSNQLQHFPGVEQQTIPKESADSRPAAAAFVQSQQHGNSPSQLSPQTYPSHHPQRHPPLSDPARAAPTFPPSAPPNVNMFDPRRMRHETGSDNHNGHPDPQVPPSMPQPHHPYLDLYRLQQRCNLSGGNEAPSTQTQRSSGGPNSFSHWPRPGFDSATGPQGQAPQMPRNPFTGPAYGSGADTARGTIPPRQPSLDVPDPYTQTGVPPLGQQGQQDHNTRKRNDTRARQNKAKSRRQNATHAAQSPYSAKPSSSTEHRGSTGYDGTRPRQRSQSAQDPAPSSITPQSPDTEWKGARPRLRSQPAPNPVYMTTDAQHIDSTEWSRMRPREHNNPPQNPSEVRQNDSSPWNGGRLNCGTAVVTGSEESCDTHTFEKRPRLESDMSAAQDNQRELKGKRSRLSQGENRQETNTCSDQTSPDDSGAMDFYDFLLGTNDNSHLQTPQFKPNPQQRHEQEEKQRQRQQLHHQHQQQQQSLQQQQLHLQALQDRLQRVKEQLQQERQLQQPQQQQQHYVQVRQDKEQQLQQSQQQGQLQHSEQQGQQQDSQRQGQLQHPQQQGQLQHPQQQGQLQHPQQQGRLQHSQQQGQLQHSEQQGRQQNSQRQGQLQHPQQQGQLQHPQQQGQLQHPQHQGQLQHPQQQGQLQHAQQLNQHQPTQLAYHGTFRIQRQSNGERNDLIVPSMMAGKQEQSKPK